MRGRKGRRKEGDGEEGKERRENLNFMKGDPNGIQMICVLQNGVAPLKKKDKMIKQYKREIKISNAFTIIKSKTS